MRQIFRRIAGLPCTLGMPEVPKFTIALTCFADSALSSYLRQSATLNFQVTVLKILVSYPQGLASMADIKRDMAILATSGRDWAERTKRLAARVPKLDIFSQGLVERLEGGWRITDKGRLTLGAMEAGPASVPHLAPEAIQGSFMQADGRFLALRNQRRQNRRRLRSGEAHIICEIDCDDPCAGT